MKEEKTIINLLIHIFLLGIIISCLRKIAKLKRYRSCDSPDKKIDFNKLKEYKTGEIVPIEYILDFSWCEFWIEKKEQNPNIEVMYLVRAKEGDYALLYDKQAFEKLSEKAIENSFISPVLKIK